MINPFDWESIEDPLCWDCEHYYEDPYNSGPGTQSCDKGQNMDDCAFCRLFEEKKLGAT